MLIDKGVTAGEVITIKLTSGEEIVAKLIEETDAYYKVSTPQVIAQGPKGIGLMPYLFTVHPEKEIKINKPVAIAEPTDADFAKQFLQATTSIALV